MSVDLLRPGIEVAEAIALQPSERARMSAHDDHSRSPAVRLRKWRQLAASGEMTLLHKPFLGAGLAQHPITAEATLFLLCEPSSPGEVLGPLSEPVDHSTDYGTIDHVVSPGCYAIPLASFIEDVCTYDLDSQGRVLESFVNNLLRPWIPDGESILTHGTALSEHEPWRAHRRSATDAAFQISEFRGAWRLAFSYEPVAAKKEKGFHAGHVYLNEPLHRFVTSVRSLLTVHLAGNVSESLGTLDSDVVFWWAGSICDSRSSWNGPTEAYPSSEHCRATQLHAACLL